MHSSPIRFPTHKRHLHASPIHPCSRIEQPNHVYTQLSPEGPEASAINLVNPHPSSDGSRISRVRCLRCIGGYTIALGPDIDDDDREDEADDQDTHDDESDLDDLVCVSFVLAANF